MGCGKLTEKELLDSIDNDDSVVVVVNEKLKRLSIENLVNKVNESADTAANAAAEAATAVIETAKEATQAANTAAEAANAAAEAVNKKVEAATETVVQEAVNAATSAQEAAESAATAQVSVDTAVSNYETAQAAAETAVETANTANKTAQGLIDSCNTAAEAANTSAANANTATEAAEKATEAATEAAKTANSVALAVTTGIEDVTVDDDNHLIFSMTSEAEGGGYTLDAGEINVPVQYGKISFSDSSPSYSSRYISSLYSLKIYYTSVSVTFSKTFASAPCVNLQVFSTTTGAPYIAKLTSISTTGFTAYIHLIGSTSSGIQSMSGTLYWSAFGEIADDE